MSSITRRDFLKSSAATAATLSELTAANAADRPGDKIVLAVVGVHGRGRELIRGFSGLDGVEIAYVCDPDENVVEPALKQLNEKQKRAPKVDKDFRHALDDKEVTAIAVATPDHWHALATVWGCQAGKHVYCEKPISHNL